MQKTWKKTIPAEIFYCSTQTMTLDILHLTFESWKFTRFLLHAHTPTHTYGHTCTGHHLIKQRFLAILHQGIKNEFVLHMCLSSFSVLLHSQQKACVVILPFNFGDTSPLGLRSHHLSTAVSKAEVKYEGAMLCDSSLSGAN